jgi:4-hydroxybenzoyl-CoA thioesterase
MIGTPLVDAQAKFVNSATYGEDIEIETTIAQWNTQSFVMTHVCRRGDTVLAEGREVRVFAIKDPADPLRIKAIPIPEDIRAACS